MCSIFVEIIFLRSMKIVPYFWAESPICLTLQLISILYYEIIKHYPLLKMLLGKHFAYAFGCQYYVCTFMRMFWEMFNIAGAI